MLTHLNSLSRALGPTTRIKAQSIETQNNRSPDPAGVVSEEHPAELKIGPEYQ